MRSAIGVQLSGAVALAIGAISAPALAAPILLTQAQFAAQTAGLVTTIETFSGFPLLTPLGSPVALANGSYSSSSPVVSDLVEFCGQPCLGSGSVADLRTFFAFPAGTTFWGATVDMVFNFPINDTIHIEAVGNGGTLPLDVIGPQNAFFGFHDPLGLVSVSFQNVTVVSPGFGISNYSFDDVVTAQPQQVVPEPSALALLLAACGAAGIARRRKHDKQAHSQ